MEGSSVNYPTSDTQFLAQIILRMSETNPMLPNLSEKERHRLREISHKGFSSPADVHDDGGGTVS